VEMRRFRWKILSAAVTVAAVTGLVVGGELPAFADPTANTLPGIGYTPFGLADWDGDGQQDAIARQDSTGDLWLYPGVGGGLSSSPILIGTGFGGYTSFGLADWDGDGHTDLVVRRDDSGDVALYTGHGGRNPLVPSDRTTITSTTPGPTFAITSGDQQDLFVQAIGTPNAVVTIAGNVDLDLSGLASIPVAPGVRIIGDRTKVAKGPRIFTTTFPSILLAVGSRSGPASDNVRISGIRFDGGEPADPTASVDTSDANGIEVFSGQHVEIDHDEFHSWRGAAIDVEDFDGRINRDNAATVWVHDNFIHDNQHPTIDGVGDALFGDHHGAGYGVSLNNGAYALIEKNVFDRNRHSVTGDGRPGTGYLVYRNLLGSPGLGFHLLGVDHYEHLIDMHGRGDCANFQCGPAGEYADVAYNAFPTTSSTEIKLRGTPSDSFNVENNAFAHTVEWADLVTDGALDQTETGLHDNGGNILGATTERERVCDFDGDGVDDVLMTTGVSWWYFTTESDERWIYLNQSNERIADLSFGDVNGDGLCDVTSNSTGNVHLTTSRLG
jgi:VCBS repeat protein